MNQANPIMQWVTLLPEVGETVLNERDAVLALMREAAEFDRLASEKRGQAYFASLNLESQIRSGHWTDAEIVAIKLKAAAPLRINKSENI